MPKKPKDEQRQVVGFVGVGLDNEDGHQRLTRADNFVLLGGSEQTHGKMQDVVIYFNETLQRRGKRLEDAEPKEALNLLREALDR